jgi:hypothetical protein
MAAVPPIFTCEAGGISGTLPTVTLLPLTINSDDPPFTLTTTWSTDAIGYDLTEADDVPEGLIDVMVYLSTRFDSGTAVDPISTVREPGISTSLADSPGGGA